MPRLLPRLIETLKGAPLAELRPRPLDKGGHVTKRRTSLYRPVPDRPSFDAVGRTQSILLDDASPVTNSRVYVRHKTIPPRVHAATSDASRDLDSPREMTAQEREWWSSPYLRMLSSPVRRCAVSRRDMPNDLLIRLIALQVPVPRGAKSIRVWVPDGLQHPKFKRRKGQRAVYITCWQDMFSATNLNRVRSPRIPNAVFHKLLAMQTAHHLRVRIIQELQLLAKVLTRRPRSNGPESTILRRLTRAEFKQLRETGLVPHQDAVAVLVVPPVNRHPIAKERPVPSIQPEITEEQPDTPATLRRKPLPPLSTMHRTKLESPEQVEFSFASLVPNAQVPLYNGLSMFPAASQRAALHKSLCEVLEAERRSHSRSPSSSSRNTQGATPNDNKGSHAFLLVSNERTVKRADSAALAIALWRLRMWKGDAYQSQPCSGGWEVDGEWRLKHVETMR
ncbi:hypothetical protein J3A83DRAFT_4125599 [Scleroderma citrinum]